MISVIILSYNRPHNLDKSLQVLTKFQLINEILIFHGSVLFYDTFCQHEKIRHIADFRINESIYTLRRFYHVSECRNENILIIDDDVYPSEFLLNDMMKKLEENPAAVCGCFQRYCGPLGYGICVINSKYSILLSKCILVKKEIVRKVWLNMIKNDMVWKRIIHNKGNGEDLFFQHEYKKLPYSKNIHVRGQTVSLDSSNGFSTTHPLKHFFIRFILSVLLNPAIIKRFPSLHQKLEELSLRNF